MLRKPSILSFTSILFCIVGLLIFNVSTFAESKDMGGWEIDSQYNKLYSVSEMDAFKGYVEKITEVVPFDGMKPGVAIHVEEAEDEIIVVHVCPTWYMDAQSIGLRRGDRIKVKGAWATIDGKDVFMASKIKKGDYFVLKVRLTKNGKPFWTMSPEELAREKAAVGSQ